MSYDKDEKASQDLDRPKPRGTEPETAMDRAPGENYDHADAQPVDETTGRTSASSDAQRSDVHDTSQSAQARTDAPSDAPAQSEGEVSDAAANPTPPVQEALTTPGVEDTPQTAPDQRH